MLSMRLVIVGAIIVIVPLLSLLLLVTLPISASVFNPIACISATNDITQVAVVSPMPSTVLLRWGDAAGRVPTGTTLVFIMSVMDWIRYGCCV
jgi:hypothetical protein